MPPRAAARPAALLRPSRTAQQRTPKALPARPRRRAPCRAAPPTLPRQQTFGASSAHPLPGAAPALHDSALQRPAC
eukprot:122661-Alexandrium_andersonii.AAC.1